MNLTIIVGVVMAGVNVYAVFLAIGRYAGKIEEKISSIREQVKLQKRATEGWQTSHMKYQHNRVK